MDWGVNSKGTTYRHFIVIVSCSFSIPSRDYHSKMLCPLSPTKIGAKLHPPFHHFLDPFGLKHQGLVRPRNYRKGNWQWARYKSRKPWKTGRGKAANSMGGGTETNWSQLRRFGGVESEGWGAEVDRSSAAVFFEWILKVACLWKSKTNELWHRIPGV